MVDATILGTNILQSGTKNIKQVKHLLITVDSTAQASDTIEVDLADYNGTELLGVAQYRHTTDNSVIVSEAGTGAISGTTVTLTIAAGTNDKSRAFEVFFQ